MGQGGFHCHGTVTVGVGPIKTGQLMPAPGHTEQPENVESLSGATFCLSWQPIQRHSQSARVHTDLFFPPVFFIFFFFPFLFPSPDVRCQVFMSSLSKKKNGLLLKTDGGYLKRIGRAAGIEEGFPITRHRRLGAA